jgi:anti-sigma factor RsiW
MRHHQQGGGGVPLPELLVAYADGQLSPAEQCHVEAWLAKNPDVAAEVEAHRRLAQCWRETQAPEPDPGRWDSVLAGVQSNLQGPRLSRSPWRRRMVMFWKPVVGIAAAILLIVLVPRGPQAPPADDDGENVTISGRHGETLVRGRLIFASDGDVQVESVEQAKDGMVPTLQPGGGSAPPMIFMAPPEKDPGKPR